MVENLFNDIGSRIKLAKVSFYAFIIIGALVFLIGAFKVFGACDKYTPLSEVLSYTAEDYAYGIAHKYEWITNGYMGKQMVKYSFFIIFSSLTTLPLYGFGHLIEVTEKIISVLHYYNKK